jgi:cytochrome b561
MATRAPSKGRQTARVRSDGTHEGFLRHANWLWLKIASIISILAIAVYALIDVQPRHNGGSWYGYTLGTIGALLILWLTMLGIRKRRMSRGHWSLKAWTSAHVYLGLGLIVIATLHTGFQLGWNVHTLAYVLMMLVILSGIFGIAAYTNLPRQMSFNRDSVTETQMLESLKAIDRQLHDAAQPLSQTHAALVLASLEQNSFGGGLWARLTNSYPRCSTRRVHRTLRQETGSRANMGGDPLEKVDSLLERKLSILARVRRHLQIKALLEIWLYFHVPLTFALIAALSAHIVSVFFYW